ncbi:MAG: [NiFe]-hydrogenase assembly chaperone HybE [Betaproteobacteria bacterium]|nr:[NiFe]-hydrogenase assembly chaperone HybE [Betaproteobacteria bacterium]
MSPPSIESWAENPAGTVAAVFRRIAVERMAGLPICNPALEVDVAGFRPWQDEWLGVLVTPWTISLLLLPGVGGRMRATPLAVGQTRTWHFPCGDYDFLGAWEEGLGPYQSCSLFSPVSTFSRQDEAMAAALAAMERLMAPPRMAGSRVEGEAAPDGHGSGSGEAGDGSQPPPRRPMSRRDFLRGGRRGS